jgi:hypothetical protein
VNLALTEGRPLGEPSVDDKAFAVHGLGLAPTARGLFNHTNKVLVFVSVRGQLVQAVE